MATGNRIAYFNFIAERTVRDAFASAENLLPFPYRGCRRADRENEARAPGRQPHPLVAGALLRLPLRHSQFVPGRVHAASPAGAGPRGTGFARDSLHHDSLELAAREDLPVHQRREGLDPVLQLRQPRHSPRYGSPWQGMADLYALVHCRTNHPHVVSNL